MAVRAIFVVFVLPVETLPAQKVKKESSGESLGESPRVLADPPKTSQKRVSVTSARTLEASEPCRKGHGNHHDGCPEHCPQWFCNCASKLGSGGSVMPCLCQVFCGNLFYEKVFPCFIVSVLRVLGLWGPKT